MENTNVQTDTSKSVTQTPSKNDVVASRHVPVVALATSLAGVMDAAEAGAEGSSYISIMLAKKQEAYADAMTRVEKDANAKQAKLAKAGGKTAGQLSGAASSVEGSNLQVLQGLASANEALQSQESTVSKNDMQDEQAASLAGNNVIQMYSKMYR